MKTTGLWAMKIRAAGNKDYQLEPVVAAIQADARAGLQAEVERLREVLRHTHEDYCIEAYAGRGLHAPECLLFEVAESVAGEQPGAGAAKEAAGEPITACPVGSGQTSRPSFEEWHARECGAGTVNGVKASCAGNIRWTTRESAGRTCREVYEQEQAAAVQPDSGAGVAPGSGQPPPYCIAGDHEPDAAAVVVSGVCIHCWQDQARIANARAEHAESRVRDLLAACEEKQESLDARTADLEAERSARAGVNMAWAMDYSAMVTQRDIARAELARVREAMPSAGMLRNVAAVLKDYQYHDADALRDAASRIEALGEPERSSAPEAVGPCPHGRDPWDRCEECGRYSSLREALADYRARREARPDPERAAVEEALREAREKVDARYEIGAILALLRAVEALARRRP